MLFKDISVWTALLAASSNTVSARVTLAERGLKPKPDNKDCSSKATKCTKALLKNLWHASQFCQDFEHLQAERAAHPKKHQNDLLSYPAFAAPCFKHNQDYVTQLNVACYCVVSNKDKPQPSSAASTPSTAAPWIGSSSVPDIVFTSLPPAVSSDPIPTWVPTSYQRNPDVVSSSSTPETASSWYQSTLAATSSTPFVSTPAVLSSTAANSVCPPADVTVSTTYLSTVTSISTIYITATKSVPPYPASSSSGSQAASSSGLASTGTAFSTGSSNATSSVPPFPVSSGTQPMSSASGSVFSSGSAVFSSGSAISTGISNVTTSQPPFPLSSGTQPTSSPSGSSAGFSTGVVVPTGSATSMFKPPFPTFPSQTRQIPGTASTGVPTGTAASSGTAPLSSVASTGIIKPANTTTVASTGFTAASTGITKPANISTIASTGFTSAASTGFSKPVNTSTVASSGTAPFPTSKSIASTGISTNAASTGKTKPVKTGTTVSSGTAPFPSSKTVVSTGISSSAASTGIVPSSNPVSTGTAPSTINSGSTGIFPTSKPASTGTVYSTGTAFSTAVSPPPFPKPSTDARTFPAVSSGSASSSAVPVASTGISTPSTQAFSTGTAVTTKPLSTGTAGTTKRYTNTIFSTKVNSTSTATPTNTSSTGTAVTTKAFSTGTAATTMSTGTSSPATKTKKVGTSASTTLVSSVISTAYSTKATPPYPSSNVGPFSAFTSTAPTLTAYSTGRPTLRPSYPTDGRSVVVSSSATDTPTKGATTVSVVTSVPWAQDTTTSGSGPTTVSVVTSVPWAPSASPSSSNTWATAPAPWTVSSVTLAVSTSASTPVSMSPSSTWISSLPTQTVMPPRHKFKIQVQSASDASLVGKYLVLIPKDASTPGAYIGSLTASSQERKGIPYHLTDEGRLIPNTISPDVLAGGVIDPATSSPFIFDTVKAQKTQNETPATCSYNYGNYLHCQVGMATTFITRDGGRTVELLDPASGAKKHGKNGYTKLNFQVTFPEAR